MYYILAYFNDRYRDFYLPDQQNWTGCLKLSQEESKAEADISIPIRALDGEWFLSLPKGYKWADKPQLSAAEIKLCDGLNITITHREYKLILLASLYQKDNTVFKKYFFPDDMTLSIGRGENCTLCFDSASVSERHASMARKRDGSVIYRDQSKNGSFINNMRVQQSDHVCTFGDQIHIVSNLKIVLLGNIIAINQPDGLRHVHLVEYVPQQTPKASHSAVPSTTLIEYQRAPRLVEKADEEEIEIEPPITKSEAKNTPLILTVGPSLTMILPMLMGTMMTQMTGNGSTYMYSGLAMIGTSAVLAVTWGLANTRHKRKQEAATEQKRISLYRDYLKEIEGELSGLNQKERNRLLRTYISAEECVRMVGGVTSRLWERMPSHSDFMEARIGVGYTELPNPIKITKSRLSLIDDPLRDEPQRLKERYGRLKDVPITIPLRTEPVVGILGRSSATAIAMSMIINLAAMHSYHDLKMVVLTDEEHYSQWMWARWLPHVFGNEDRTLRMVVSTPLAITEVLTYLDEIIAMRRDEENERKKELDDPNEELDPMLLPIPHYVVFCMKPELLENEPVMHHLISRVPGFTLVVAAPTMEQLPKECRIIVSSLKKSAGLYNVKGDIKPLTFEAISTMSAERFSKSIANIRVHDSEGGAAIPTLVKFLDLYQVQRTEDLDIWRFWNENHAYDGLRSSLGLGSGGRAFVLDISDRRHGPHGLIAGTTGSGKSVMLQSYILSLAINYPPEQVQFVLIDYKGGGMADAFVKLPHVAGTIDNLQGSRSIRRALASIQGEIRRRENIFKAVGVSNIDEYIRFYNDDPQEDPLGHLIIVVDEFAELKKEQPEFMHELISASRVGRSVGIHLILATQKPSNSVDDEIWSNARFHVCLRVQTRTDSVDMLKRPDAAYIKGMGRCFVQVGSDEIFEEVQTGWSGAEYEPDNLTADEKPYLLNDAGQPIKFKAPRSVATGRKDTQMDAVLRQMESIVTQHHVRHARKLWMPELPSTVYLTNMPEYTAQCFANGIWPTTNEDQLSAVVGLADDLQNQLRIPVEIDFSAHRNHLIVGLSATGKTTFLQTLAISLACKYSPERLQMYTLSLSSRVLACLEDLPHMGEVLYEDESNEIIRLLHMLNEESDHRRARFAKAATDNFISYNRSARATAQLEQEPAIVVLVDRMGELSEMLNDDDSQLLYSLIREGSGRGIYFVATALAINEVYNRIRDCFFGVALQLHERGDYSDVLGKRMPMEMCDIATNNGRGIVVIDGELYEMQLALYGDAVTDLDRVAQIRAKAIEMKEQWHGSKPKHVPRIPEKPTWKQLQQDALARGGDAIAELPLGYLGLEGVPFNADLSADFAWLVAGGKLTGKTSFLYGIGEAFAARGAEIHILGGTDWKAFANANTAMLHSPADTEDIGAFTETLHQMIAERNKQRKAVQTAEGKADLVRSFRPYVILLDDLYTILNALPPQTERLLTQCCTSAAGFGIYLFASISSRNINLLRAKELVQALCAKQNGLSMCGKLSDNDLWDVQTNYATRSKVMPMGEAYLVHRGAVKRIVLPFH